MKTQSSYFQNLSTVVSVLDEACGVLPAAPALIAQGLNAQLVELVEGCRAHSAVQKRVLEREMEVWQLVEEQKRSELFAQNKATGPINSGWSEELEVRHFGFIVVVEVFSLDFELSPVRCWSNQVLHQ
jgi:hypothetical protein